MIQINLLPGDGKKKRRATTTTAKFEFNFKPPAWLSGLTERMTDKYMLGAVAAAGASILLIAMMFISQSAKGAMLETRETKAIKDSTQFSTVLVAKAKAETARDSLYQQIAIIKSIDDSRYLWSHLMYEISNALPQYTWLTEITQTSAPRSAAAADTSTATKAPSDTTKSRLKAADRERAAKKARSDSLLATAKDIKFKIVGHTVDIQALTRFMKSLEASPFIQNVNLSKSDLVQAEGKEVTEFTLEAETQPPPPFAIKTVPLIVSAVR
jgi:type IV pilus assembly protein PilN